MHGVRVRRDRHCTIRYMVILGIDPGYERCGVAVLEKGVQHDRLLYSACLTTLKSLPFGLRLVEIGAGCAQLIDTYEVTDVALETLYFTKNQKTAMHVAEVRGALLYLAHTKGCHVVEYGPGEIKSAIAGDGRADKRQVMQMVRQLLRLEVRSTSDDEFDAIAVALTASAHLRLGRPRPAKA